jgi:hypothetical protein
MKDFVHKPITVDGLFKERLEELPVDAWSCDLQWQVIKEQVKHAPSRLPGINVITIFLGVSIAVLLLWGIPYKTKDAPGDTSTPSKELPAEDERHQAPVENKENKQPASSPRKNQEPAKSFDSTNEKVVTFSPVISPGKTDSGKRIVIIHRPDSSKLIAMPESKKDSLFIFW